jgi:hypothetical protein
LAAATLERRPVTVQRLTARPMIIRHKHEGRFVIVPNGIFHDRRLSLAAKGLLAYLLSLPPNWEVRHDQLQRKLGIGRRLLERSFKELIAAGYAVRDEMQGRDERNRFTTLNYVVSDTAVPIIPDDRSPMRARPGRKMSSGNNKEEIKTDFNKPISKSLSVDRTEAKGSHQVIYSDFGQRALFAGNRPVYVGSKPYEAWREFRGDDGMPGFIDRAMVDGRPQDLVWMPSVYPPNRRST